jgi:hypothetical protein
MQINSANVLNNKKPCIFFIKFFTMSKRETIIKEFNAILDDPPGQGSPPDMWYNSLNSKFVPKYLDSPWCDEQYDLGMYIQMSIGVDECSLETQQQYAENMKDIILAIHRGAELGLKESDVARAAVAAFKCQ